VVLLQWWLTRSREEELAMVVFGNVAGHSGCCCEQWLPWLLVRDAGFR